jgi:hypothetical protein
LPQKKDEGNKPNPFQKGHVNHINVEENYDEPDAVYGIFLLNKFSTHVLSDTGASHSFQEHLWLRTNYPLKQ